tara:strand:+ start:777 stop:2123 length:1347 start_codon:yes stop_codon:yes gene_type:complete
MAQREAKALVREHCNKILIESITLSFEFLPLPNPPLELPDFPARPPSDKSKIIQQALGLFSIDTAGFLFRLEQVIEKDEPNFIKSHIDREKEREKWLSKNLELTAEQIIILQVKDWFYSALDENSPDTDRWYLAVSIFIGLILRGSKITEAQCFPLFSSIIVAKQPDEPTMKQISGPHHISWSGENSDASSEELAHPSGVLAANAILDIIELYEINNETVLPYWLERLSIGEHISNILNIPMRTQNLIFDNNQKNYENLVMATILLFPHHPNESKEILFEICNNEQVSLRRNLASNLSRIGSEDRDFSERLLAELLNDEDPDTRVLSTTYLGTLARLESHSFIILSKKIFQNKDSRMIQRLIESGIRHYLSMNPDDDEGLIPIAWVSCNSESKSTLSGMLIELAKINQQSFQKICSKVLHLSPESYNELFNRIDLRNKDISSLIKNNQ